jgi:hypothetical protein
MGLEEKIIEELKKSGYPLEIKVTLALESRGWNVLNQEGYIDVEANKWRTIDILATKSIELSESIYERLHLSLAIECKKIEKPWVFFVRYKKPLRIFDPLAACGLIKLESKPFIHPLHFENLVDCFHYYSPDFSKVAVISYEPFQKTEKSIIFEAKTQVIKFLSYDREKMRDFFIMEEAKEKVKHHLKTTNLISVAYPLIIVAGDLFEVEFEDEKPKLIRSNYIQYLTSFGIPFPESYLIDIMKIDFLKEYLDIIEEKAQQFANKVPSIQSPSKAPFS